MSNTIMPSFDRYVKEGNLIGRLLAGYGELELEMADCVAAVTNDLNAAIKKLFGVRGELKRIRTAASMMEVSYAAAGFGPKCRRAMASMNYCRELRNQYAHCNWYDTTAEGLCFIDLEHTATLQNKITLVTKHRYPINVSLLSAQEAYFKYVQGCFWYLGEAYRLSKSAGHKQAPIHSWPGIRKRPRKHN